MKKKLAIMCIMGAVVTGLAACGSKSDSDAESVAVAAEDTDGESEIEWVRDREDYVDMEDLDIDQYVSLTDYADLNVSVAKDEADDDSIESYINNYLLVGEITNRAVESGDYVNIDYVGKKDGEAFSGGTATGYTLGIGTGTFIDGFEDGLIGVLPGETVDLDLTFPEDYSSSDLAGQEVVFTVTVNYIVGSGQYSTITVEDMQAMGLEYESLEELWEAGKAAIEASNEEAFLSNARSAVVEKITADSEVLDVPQWIVDEQKQYYMLYLDQVAELYYGVDFETYVTTYMGETMEDVEADINKDCEEVAKTFVVLEAIARQEGISLSEDDVKSQAQEDYLVYGYESADEFMEYVGYTTYRMSLLQELVEDKLMDIVEVTPESATE